jgi:transcriptional regulator with XRE-family HTH domain
MRNVPLKPQQQFGKNICRLRMRLTTTQEKLSEKADISRRYLQQIEAGQMNPSVGVASRLRKALRCSWDELLQGL